MQTTQFPHRCDMVVERLSDFMAHLRGNGIAAGTMELDAATRAFTSFDVLDMSTVKRALKSICTGNRDAFDRFDDLFAGFWMNRGREKAGTERKDISHKSRKSNLDSGDDGASNSGSGKQTEVDDGRGGEASLGGEGKLAGSRITNIETTDFRHLMTPEALAEAERVAQLIAKQIRDRRSRRYRIHHRGSKLDLRRIARAAVQSGGEPFRLFKRKKPDRPVTLVALLDVSYPLNQN